MSQEVILRSHCDKNIKLIPNQICRKTNVCFVFSDRFKNILPKTNSAFVEGASLGVDCSVPRLTRIHRNTTRHPVNSIVTRIQVSEKYL